MAVRWTCPNGKLALQARAERSQAREHASEDAYFSVDGLNLRDEMCRALTTSATLRRSGVKTVALAVRRPKKAPRTTLGRAWFYEARISITAGPASTRFDVCETLIHELAHLAYGRPGHGVGFKAILRLIAEEVYGIRPRLIVRWHGEIAELLEAKSLRVAGD